MKRVVSESQVAHLWAHQTQSDARKSNNSFYFEGRTIYSYGSHFPIAVIDKKDPNIVYFTTRTYSNTTAGHISTARSAVSHKTLIYCKHPQAAASNDHEANMNDFEDNARSIAQSLPSSRKPEIYLLKIAAERKRMEAYVEHFKLNVKEYVLAYIYIKDKDGSFEAGEETERAMKVAEQARKRRQKAAEAKQLKSFRSFKIDRIHSRIDKDYLRFNTETNRVETSQGVEIPEGIAKRFYHWAMKTIEDGGCSGNCEEKILEYRVQSVNKDFMKIGCHNIPVSEVNLIAKQLNW